MTTPDSARVEPDQVVPTTVDELAPLYRQMLAIRRMEEASAKAYSQGKIGGFLHLIIGQEAVCVGSIATLRPDDYVVATYREHGHAYAKGIAARPIMAELYGKKTGLVKGLGGSMHLFDKATNFLGGHGIVGGHVPLAAGAAFASKYRGDGRVTLCYFGDGAATIGGFAEGLALAALWKLPLVLICENNQYSMGTPLYRSLAVEDVSLRALAHGMARDRFDGDDVIRVKRRIAEAVERARVTGEPTLVEIVTYRFRGHSMSDRACTGPRTRSRSGGAAIRSTARAIDWSSWACPTPTSRRLRRTSRPRSRTRCGSPRTARPPTPISPTS
jgi:pyruvate dehydrogenase E1 component alpha subunit